MCQVLIENLNDKNSIKIYLMEDDFNNLEKVDDMKSYCKDLLLNMFIYSSNIDKINDLFTKSILKKLCSYIDKFEKTVNCKINSIKFIIFDNNIYIDYSISDRVEISL